MARHATKVHRDKLSINEKVAIWFANALGSPWTIYLFIILACVSLPQVIKSGDIVLIVAWIAQTFIQLVALAILQAKAVIDGKHSEELAQQMYENMLAVEQMDEDMHEKLDLIIRKL